METPKRLNKYLSEIGYCSRREADRLIEKGAVKVNGKIPEMGIKVTTNDQIEVYNKEVSLKKDERVYLALNKPRGIVCTTDTKVEKDNIIDFVNYYTRIFPIGRLDKDSEGLILLTNDGDIVNKILRSSNQHEKEYVVSVDKPISQTFVKRMSEGIYLEELGQKTKRCYVEKVSKNVFKIILTQGLNRQIRRMCSYLNYEVQTLKRTRIMNVSLDIPLGKYRKLSKDELSELNNLLSNSIK